ncbi:MAG: hypothetical protein ACWGNK_11130, partial [Desulfobacterales bacterium]
MQNDDKSAMASEAKNLLSDDDIIEFAETVLADLDDGDGGNDQEMALEDDDDDIIDLTEVADKPESSDDFLELSEDVDMGPSAEDDILELKDIAEQAEGEEDVAFELEDDIEDLVMEDDADIDVDDELNDPTGADEDDADGREVISEPYDFADEEETFDLSLEEQVDMASSDLEDEDADFDFEPAAENLGGDSDESPLSSDAGEAETLPEPENRVYEEYPAEGDAMTVALQAPPLEDQGADLIGGHIGNQIENQSTDGHQEKLELTEADRRLLEEELSLDIDDEISADKTDDRDGAENADRSLDDATDPDSYHHAEYEETADAANAPASLTAEAAQPDFAEASGGGTPETFDFDFDETAEDNATAESEPPMFPSIDDEKLAVESLLADSDLIGVAEPYRQPIDEAEGTPEAGETGSPEPPETEFGMETQMAGASGMNLDPTDTPDPHDGLTAAETMSIPAAGLSGQQRADDDAPEGIATETIPET